MIEVVSAHTERTVLRVNDTFVKIETDPGRATREVDALRTLTSVPVPTLLWHEFGPPDVLAVSVVPGRQLAVYGEPDWADDDAWRATGAALRALHDGEPSGSPSKTDFVVHLDAYEAWFTQHRLDALPVVAPLLAFAREFFAAHEPLGARVHGDMQPDHVFIAEGAVTGIIDWADTGYGDPLTDIAVLTIGHRDHLDAVLDGYCAGFDADAVRAYWILRKCSVIHWRVAHDLPYEDDVVALAAL